MGKNLTSEELMARIAKGDESAFQTLVERHQISVLNMIYRFIGDSTKSQDLAQEVFLRVWQTAKRYEPKAKFTTWLYRIATNLCLNELKASRRRKWLRFFHVDTEGQGSGEEDFSDGSPSPEELLLSRERSREITGALQSLPENQRMALILKRYEGLSYEEIAGILNCSVSAVESLLVRAKRNLQQKLKTSEKSLPTSF
jgi:RNA polymerase sigma-70 factor (ECF subfamily)